MPKANAKEHIYRRIPWPGDVTDATSLSGLARAHMDDLRVKNFSQVTIDGRSYPLRFFLTWCYDRDITKPTEVTSALIERYQRYISEYRMKNGFTLTPLTQHGYLVTITQFFRWMTKRGLVPFNPTADIERPKLPRHLPRYVLSVSQIEHLMSQADTQAMLGLRDRTIMEVMYSSGIRRKELIGLRLTDVNYDQGTLFIAEGKGGHQRVVPIGVRALAWLHQYLEQVRPACVTNEVDWIFLTNIGEQIALATLTRMIRDYVHQAGFGAEKAGSCHLFRHSCATHMLENGADIRVIQELLGHVCLVHRSVNSSDIFLVIRPPSFMLAHAYFGRNFHHRGPAIGVGIAGAQINSSRSPCPA